MEGPAGRLGRAARAAGGHGGEVPLLHHGEGPDGLDGEHHPADRDPGEATVSWIPRTHLGLGATLSVLELKLV